MLCYNRSMARGTDDETFMYEALVEAQAAYQQGEVPVGAVVVHNQYVVGRGHNRKEELEDPTAHAELLALREAAQALRSWRLSGVTLYSTMEPCPMCAGAAVLARVPRLVYAVDDPKSGASGSVFDITGAPRLNHQVEVSKGVLAKEAGELLAKFFSELRDPDLHRGV